MSYKIERLRKAIKVTPAAPEAARLEIEAQLWFRFTKLGNHHTEAFTRFPIVDEAATDADIRTIRQILQKHEDAASQLRMARHREQMELDMGMGGEV